MSFGVTWVDLEIIVLSELSHTKKGKYHITYMWNLKNDANELFSKAEMDALTENELMVTKRERGDTIF